MSASKPSNADQIALDTNMIAGLIKHRPALPASLTLAGQAATVDTAVTTLQARIAAANAVAPAKAVYAKVVLANQQEKEATEEFVADLKAFLVLTNKKSPDILADYGITLKKRATPTPAMKVVAAAKSLVTRKLRGTKGPKQNAPIKGALTGPLVAPVAASAATTPPEGPSRT